MRALQGTWNVVNLEVDGQGAAAGGATIVLDGTTFSTNSMGEKYRGTFTVDTQRTPNTIDIAFTEGQHAGLKSLGIFRLKGDTWTLCLGLAGGMQRPAKFATTPGSGHALETLTRAGSKADKAAASAAAKPAAANAAAKSPSRPAAAMTPAMAEHGGEWAMVSLDQSGKPGVAPEYLHFGKRTVIGDEMTVTMNNQIMTKATFTVNPSTSPKSIDYRLIAGGNKGKTQLGIYEVTANTARYCMAAPGDARPADFVTSAGDGRTLSVWKRP